MARHMTEPVKTFSVGFAGAGETNELADARHVSTVLGTDHHELELSTRRPGRPRGPVLAHGRATRRPLGTWLPCVVRARVPPCHRGSLRAGRRRAVRRLPQAPRRSDRRRLRTCDSRSRAARRRVSFPTEATLRSRRLGARDPVERLLAASTHLAGAERERLVTGPLAACARNGRRESCASVSATCARDALGSALYLDARLGLADDMLHYFDRASMAHSLEVRVPFLDHQLVELCATIPSAYKLHRFRRSKHVLKIAARGLVPDRIIDKPKVGFFNRSVEGWLRAQTRRARSPSTSSTRARACTSSSTGTRLSRSSAPTATAAGRTSSSRC